MALSGKVWPIDGLRSFGGELAWNSTGTENRTWNSSEFSLRFSRQKRAKASRKNGVGLGRNGVHQETMEEMIFDDDGEEDEGKEETRNKMVLRS